MDAYYKTIKLIFKIFHLASNQDYRAYGDLNLPPGAKIIAGNHPNATDGFFLPFVFKEQLHFFIQGDLYNIPLMGWLFAKSEQIRVIPDQKKLALEHALKLLLQDKVVAIFPEARLNPDGQPVKSGTGAIRLSLQTRKPLIPIGFYVPPKNLHHISRMKKGKLSQGHWQIHGRCYLHVGSPWLPQVEADTPLEQVDLRSLTERLMGRINDQVQLAKQVFRNETGLPADLVSLDFVS